jgi:hypothetical protein
METELLTNYSRLCLKGNPFPYVSVPEEEPSYYFDQEAALKCLLRVLASTHATASSNHAVLVGTYGSGKSHTLKHLAERVKNELNRANRKAVAFYVPHPGLGIIDVYRSIVAQLGPNAFAKLSSFVDERAHYQFELYRPIRVISQKSNEMLNAWRWLTGEKLEISQRNKLGVGRNIDDKWAIDAFKQIMMLLRRAGYNLVAILIDELETVNELDLFRRQRLFNTFRHLFDDNPNNLSVVFACTPAGWDEILANAFALARRISRNVVYLEALDEKRIQAVIEGYIKKSRTRTDDLKSVLKELGDQTTGSIYPFTLAAVPELLRLCQGNIGELIKYCNLAIERAAMDTQCKAIDAKVLNNLLPEFQR